MVEYNLMLEVMKLLKADYRVWRCVPNQLIVFSHVLFPRLNQSVYELSEATEANDSPHKRIWQTFDNA